MAETYLRGARPDGSSGLAKMTALDELVVSVGGGGAGAPVVTAGNTARVGVEITRPAGGLTYAPGALVGALITLPGCARAAAGTGYVTLVRLATNSNVSAGASFRVYVWSVAPTVPADNAPFALLYADLSPTHKMVGFTDLTLAPEGSGSDAAYGFDAYVRWPFVCAAGSDALYATVVARGTYAAAAAQKFSLGVGLERN